MDRRQFRAHTKASVVAFQAWAASRRTGFVGDQTWAVSLRAASATLETAVGLQFAIGSSHAANAV
jgi:hypothetical protein